MSILPNIPMQVSSQAKSLWESFIDQYGENVKFIRNSDDFEFTCLAVPRRPKILGLFDRTEQSFDQTRFMVMVKSSDFTSNNVDPEKFDRVEWDGTDHATLSVTNVRLGPVLFGYRILVKG